jgi:hypothetical protein
MLSLISSFSGGCDKGTINGHIIRSFKKAMSALAIIGIVLALILLVISYVADVKA